MARGHDLFRSAALVAAVLCYSTILLGGTVMASDDGLGCPHWPSCFANGNLDPHVQGAAQVEWSHRVAAFFLALSVLALTVLAVAYERQRRILLGLSGAALALVVGEALLGGLVVESSLSVVLVLGHLAIATALFGLLLVIALLANLREMPKRWVAWARRATEERPAAPPPEAVPEPRGDRGPAPFPRARDG
jgi:heme A synthase